MSRDSSSAQLGSTGELSPAPGWYPVPNRKGDAVDRQWDGDVWTEATRDAAPTATLADYRRDLVRFLQFPGWLLLLVIVGGSVGALLLVRIDDGRKLAEGVQWLAVPLAFAATASVMASFLLFLDHRLRFGQVVQRWAPIVGWGVLSGAVAIVVAVGLEELIPRAFDSSLTKDRAWYFLPGPAEEFAKVLVPVILWFTGRYRLPRQGFLLVILSAMTFGVFEGSEYAAEPASFQVSRPVAELMHPMFIGFAAAYAWRAAWGRRSWFTRTGVLSVLAAMLLHSLNDGLIGLDTKALGITTFITPLVILIAYLAMKHAARQMVPPDNVERVSPRWRPVAPERTHTPS